MSSIADKTKITSCCCKIFVVAKKKNHPKLHHVVWATCSSIFVSKVSFVQTVCSRFLLQMSYFFKQRKHKVKIKQIRLKCLR